MKEADYDALIGAVYDAGASPSEWPRALSLIAAAYGAEMAGIASYGPGPVDRWGMLGPDIPALGNEYLTYYYSKNVFLQKTAHEPAGSIQSDTMVMPKREFRRTEFYNDFLVRFDIHSMSNAVLTNSETRFVEVAVNRQKDFEQADLGLLRRLLPHLQRAFHLNIRLAHIDLYRFASIEVLERLASGAVVVDRRARVLFVNKIAEELFRDGAGLRLRDNVLAAEIYSESERLQRMIAESHSAECFRDGALSTLEISRGAGRRSLSVLVAPLRMARNDTFLDDAYSIVIIKDSDARKKPPASILRSRFSLTTAEARLALEILNGDGIAAAARRLSVSQTTARTHLAQVFAKTGTRRQAELVRILLELM